MRVHHDQDADLDDCGHDQPLHKLLDLHLGEDPVLLIVRGGRHTRPDSTSGCPSRQHSPQRGCSLVHFIHAGCDVKASLPIIDVMNQPASQPPTLPPAHPAFCLT